MKAVGLCLVTTLLAVGALADSEILVNPDNGHRYQRIDQLLVWHDARDHCGDLGGYLVSITSERENDFVRFIPRTTQIWLGGTDEKVEGQWEWVSGENWVYSKWAPGEPNNLYPEHYLIMHSGLVGLWNDYRGIVPRPFVCEWPTTEVPTLSWRETFILAITLLACAELLRRGSRRRAGEP